MKNKEIMSLAMQVVAERKEDLIARAESIEVKVASMENEKRKARRLEEAAQIRAGLEIKIGNSVNKLAMSYASQIAGRVLKKGQPPAQLSLIIDFLNALQGISNNPFNDNMLSSMDEL